MKLGTLVLALVLAASPATAVAQARGDHAVAAAAAMDDTQIQVGPAGEHLQGEEAEPVDIITPHITDSHHLELPFIGELELPRWESTICITR